MDMSPVVVEWKALRFGIEIEFVSGDPAAVELLPDWNMALDERQVGADGRESGSELQSPPLRWRDRAQIREMLARLRATGAEANWSCGLHVHVGVEAWGQDAILPLVDAALACQDGLRVLLQTADDRLKYCPNVTPQMRERFLASPRRDELVHRGRPQSHRCGINAAAWFDVGTVEIRFANGSLDYGEVRRTVELCLRFVAAVGAGANLPGTAADLAAALGAPTSGYPPPKPAPQWYRERMWLEEALIPVLGPLTAAEVPDGEVHHILPAKEGILVAVERPDDKLSRFLFGAAPSGWQLLRVEHPGQ